MIVFYFLSLLPIAIGAALWVLNKNIVLWEWLAGTGSALLLSGIFHLISIHGMTSDEEVWSGQITSVRQFSAWKEFYETEVYKTVYTGTGKNRKSRRVFDHWESHRRWHNEHWVAYSNIDSEYDIDKNHYNKLVKAFGGYHAVAGKRTTGQHASRMIDGDPNDYVADNKTGYIEPIVEVKSFENRVKAAPSVFSFVKVPATIPVFAWPRPNNPWSTQRVLGTAQQVISQREWDEMNAILGPRSKVNLIIIGFNSDDTSLLQYQEAKFIGGKKNDLCISFCGPPQKPTAVKVFGWTESEVFKKDIESWIIEHGVSKDLITFLKTEVPTNYKLKDWSKFKTISIEPHVKYYYWFFGFLIVTQGALYFFFHKNTFDKGGFVRNTWERIANL